MVMQRLRESARFLWKLLLVILHEALSWLSPPKKKSIADDIILITGGGRGIGKSIALHFAEYHPKHIILWGRTQSALSQTAKEVQENGVNCSYMVCDVSSREQIYSMAKEVEAKFGQVTILVNNAGVVNAGSILKSDPEVTEATLRTNTMAHFWTTRSFMPGMIAQNKGHIVTISSVLGFSGLNGAADYCTSKFATSGFTEALSDELKSTGVTGVKVTGVYPYMVDNSMFAGTSTRFPWLFPPIQEDYLGKKIVDAVLVDRRKLIVPKIMYLVACFYSIAPASVILPIMKFTGVHHSMDQYHEYHARASGQS